MTALPVDRSGSAVTGVPPTDERLPALDGLRGAAILLVMIYHFFIATGPLSNHRFDRAITDVAGVGWIGVDLFFVLSGFLITGILVDAKSTAAPFFRTFYARRSLRIFPVYYLLLLGLLIVLPEIRNLDPQRVANFRDNQWWYWLYAANIHTAIDGGQAVDLVETWHLWSLAVEEQFYLVWPALVFILPRRGMLALCISCIIGAFALRVGMVAYDVHPAMVHGLTPARIDALAAGSLLALIARSATGLRQAEPWIVPAAITGLGVCIVLFVSQGGLDPYDRPVQIAGFSALVLLFSALLVATVTAPPASPVHRIMTLPPLRSLGRYSYAVYVFHWPLVVTLSANGTVVEALPEVGGSMVFGRVVFAVIAFVVSFTVAWLSWHLFEKHILKLKDHFPYDRSGRRDRGLLAENPRSADIDPLAQRPTSNL